MDVVGADETEITEVKWVWPGRIAEGKVTLLAGDPGVGKSMISLDVAARVTRGKGFVEAVDRHEGTEARGHEGVKDEMRRMDPWADVRAVGGVREEASPMGERVGEGRVRDAASGVGGQVVEGRVLRAGEAHGSAPMESAGFNGSAGGLRALRNVGAGEKGKVLIFSAEDEWGDTVLPRLKAAGADLKNVMPFGSLSKSHESWVGFSVRRDLERLEYIIESYRPRLMILDPITACMEGIDQNSTSAVRQHLAPLAHMAARFNMALLGITHLNKRRRSMDIYRTTGSLAVAAVARAVHFAIAGEDGGPCTLAAMKSNLSVGAEGLAYKVADGKVEWLGGVVKAERVQDEEEIFEKHDRGMAREFLAESLADGPRVGEALIRQAKRLAISERTLRRAKAVMGVRSQKEMGAGGEWYWLLEGQRLG